MLIWMKRWSYYPNQYCESAASKKRGRLLSPFSAGNKPRGFTLSVRRSVCSGGPSFFWFLIYLSVCFVCLSLFVCPSCYAVPSLLCIHPSFCPPSVLLLSSFCPPFVLLSSFCPPSVLLLSSFCPSSVLLLSSFCLCYCPCLWYCLLLLSFLILLCPSQSFFFFVLFLLCLSVCPPLLFCYFILFWVLVRPSVRPFVFLIPSSWPSWYSRPSPRPPYSLSFFHSLRTMGPDQRRFLSTNSKQTGWNA